jgi:assimilatory nitrate reductase catalytic subunit
VTALVRKTTCPYCGVGCGIVTGAGPVTPDAAHPANLGRICSKGAALAETLVDRDRLTAARIDGSVASVDAALDRVAERFAAAIAADGPDSVAFYGSGQFLTEDYYVANKLMKGFIGSANMDTNSRLCMASTVAGHKRGFGADIVPGLYADLDETDLAVMVGSNAAWCHPVLHQRLLAARARRGTRLVAIDPRRTATADQADLFLPLAPGSDIALFAGLLVHLDARGAIDLGWVQRHTQGLDAALAMAREGAGSLAAVAAATELTAGAIAQFYDWFAETERSVTLFSQGVNQSKHGTDKVNAILNVHLATGRIGRPGMGPFSLTGQPNAMGGREVGGLTNMLAAHMDFAPADRDRVARFWGAERVAERPGLKAVELFEAVGDGRIKAIWIAATNPAASMPRAAAVREALARCPFVVVSDCWETDTTRLAHVVLPAEGWGEKDGTVTNSERCISRQRRFREAPGEARADWRLFAGLGQRLGFGAAFAWGNPSEVFAEHAALSAFENDGGRLFDIGGLANLDAAAYDAMEPVRWPYPTGATAQGGRLFADGGFPTADGRARIVAVPVPQAAAVRGFTLNTGRLRDQWHTMTRTGIVPRLMTHTPAAAVSLNPGDARALMIQDGEPVEIETAHGRMVLPVTLDPGQRPRQIFVPMHWTETFSAAGAVGRLASAERDPVSGQPDLKGTQAAITPLLAYWYGVMLTLGEAPPAPAALWSRIPLARGWLTRLTGLDPLPADPAALLPLSAGTETIIVSDPAEGVLRLAALQDGRLIGFLAIAPERAGLPPTDWLAGLLGEVVPTASRLGLCGGRPPEGGSAGGDVLCACFGVTVATLRRAIAIDDLTTTEAVGAATRAGTNCRSCIPEIAEMLRDAHEHA